MMRRAAWRAIDDAGYDMTPAVGDDRDEQSDQRAEAARSPRGADADERPHQEAEIQAADVDEEAFQDVRVAPQVRPTHPAGLVEIGVRPL